MRFEPTFRSVRMRPADGPSNGSETLSRIQSLADYTIAMLESSFRKRQGFCDDHNRVRPMQHCSRSGGVTSATMVALIFLFFNLVASFFKSKSRLEAENAAMQHQLTVLHS